MSQHDDLATYLLACVDHSTRWPESIPISDISAETVAHVFLKGGIDCFVYLPLFSSIVTDCGCQFESHAIEEQSYVSA